MRSAFGVEAEGYVIPYGNGFSRAKILQRHGKFGIELRKYAQVKGTKPKLYKPNILEGGWQKVFDDVSRPLLVTEGEKKAAAACKVGLPCVGVGGVWCFKSKDERLLPDWDDFALDGRTVLIVYDSDIVDKPQVMYAEYALARELTSRGASVMRVRLPEQKNGEKVGLDDFLAGNGLPNNAVLAKEAFEKLPREKIEVAHPPELTEMGNSIRFEQAYMP